MEPIGEELKLRKAPVGGRLVTVVSYRNGDKFLCRVDNIDPVTVIARAEGRSRAQAELAALRVARRRLTKNRSVYALAELHIRVASLDRHLSEPLVPFVGDSLD